MDDLSLNEGEEFYGILGELIIDPETGRRRVVTQDNLNIQNGRQRKIIRKYLLSEARV